MIIAGLMYNIVVIFIFILIKNIFIHTKKTSVGFLKTIVFILCVVSVCLYVFLGIYVGILKVD